MNSGSMAGWSCGGVASLSPRDGMASDRPCPFCYNTDLLLYESWHIKHGNRVIVRCVPCKAEAVREKWNQRPAEDALERVLDRFLGLHLEYARAHCDMNRMPYDEDEETRRFEGWGDVVAARKILSRRRG